VEKGQRDKGKRHKGYSLETGWYLSLQFWAKTKGAGDREAIALQPAPYKRYLYS